MVGILIGAGEETQTLDLFLGKEALYQLSYTRIIFLYYFTIVGIDLELFP